MELERLSVALRPRNNWEAVDLGLRLAVCNLRALYASWMVVALPVAALIFLVVGGGLGKPAWAAFALWWLKPAFDRIGVHVISHAVFGEAPSVRDTLRALPRLLGATGLLWGLTLGRFSLQRSALLPVDVLEGLKGAAARQRKSLISRRISNAAIWQTLAWLHLETVFWLGFWAMILLMIPKELLPDFNWLDLIRGGELPSWLYWCSYAPLWLASVLLEPLYIAGGFMLYIKRRTDLEAWDIELQLRRLNQRKEASSLFGILASAALALMLGAVMLSPGEAQAATSRDTAIAKAPETLKEVLKQPEFGKDEVDHQLKWHDDWRKSDTKDPSWQFPDWFKDFAKSVGHGLTLVIKSIAALGRIGGWLLIALAVMALAYLISRFRWQKTKRLHIPPAELAGFDIRPQSLPKDIAAHALELLRNNDPRGALSLLFRGSLSRLAHREQVPFTRGDTEGDCLERVRKSAPARSGFFARLLGCWQRLAYAHRVIPPSEIEALCEEWWREFGRGDAHV
ncbi:DUF4129 domain-containing protein [Uliginosibacterium gangwonense]|uniref:DUF4129 domain-containing protein n=1 Tax=Uliginosibacterium gangwonense TaxID=392736 RepID=UPI000368D86A|nr:DUF4129 domain-containing protein [Uliginosibacterium gangwonense]